MELRSVSYLVGLMKRVYGSPSGFSSCSEIAWRGSHGFGVRVSEARRRAPRRIRYARLPGMLRRASRTQP
jgi:hypothetical protein